MESRACKRCTAQFEPDFATQVNCAPCKQRNTEEKQQSRAKKKAAETPTYDEWTWKWDEKCPQQYKELRAYEKKFSAQVQQELGRELCDLEAETIYNAAVASYCFKQHGSPWVRAVIDPNGIIVGGAFYPEVIGSWLVKYTHRFGLESSSATYAKLYRPLLTVLNKRFGKCGQNSSSEGESARNVQAELAGKYTLSRN
jgi:hypothetical protein